MVMKIVLLPNIAAENRYLDSQGCIKKALAVKVAEGRKGKGRSAL